MIGHCPSCKKSIAVPDGAAGKKARCSGCQAVFVIEAPTAQTSEALEVTEILDDEEPIQGVKLDVLEEVSAAPASKSTKTAARKKKDASRPAYDDRDDEVVPEPSVPAADEGSLDFSREMPKVSAGVQMRVSAAANWMSIGAVLSVVMSLLVLVQLVLVTLSPAAFIAGMISSGMMYILAIIIIPCARSLGLLRSRAVGITAAVLCLVVALPGIGVVISNCIAVVAASFMRGGLVAQFFVVACMLAVVGLFQVASCLWGGINTLVVVFRADVDAAITDANDLEARSVMKSATIVPSACNRAVLWQILALVLLLVNLTTYMGFFVYLLIRPIGREHETTMIMAALGVTSFFYTIMLLMNIGAIVSLFTKRYFALTTMGSISCLVTAFISYVVGLSEIPLIVAAMAMNNVLLLWIGGITAVFMLLQNLVGVFGYISGMDAARLLRKFGPSPEATDSEEDDRPRRRRR